MLQNLVKIILCVSVILPGSYGQASAEATKASVEVDVGEQAPDFKLKDTEGKPVTLKDFREEKIVVLDFWASWCGPCLKAIPELNTIHKDYAEKDVQVLGINSLVRERRRAVISFKRKHMKYPCLIDVKGTVARDYRVKFIPTLVLIDKDGIVHYKGFNPHELKDALKKLVKQYEKAATKN